MLELINTVGPELVGNWSRYRKAHRSFDSQLKRFPGLQVETLNLRKQLSQVFNVSERQVKYCWAI